MNEAERIIDQLERAYNGDAWCGTNLRDAVKDLSATQAAQHPIENAHSIWEITLHCAAWMDAVRERMTSEYVRLPADGDWQTVDDTSEAAWRAALEKLDDKQMSLVNAVEGLSDKRLDEKLGDARDRELGAGVSRYVMLHGIVQHNLYHASQIVMLRKMLKSAASN